MADPRKIKLNDVVGPIDAADEAGKAAARDALDLGDAAVLDAENPETATGYHIITRTAAGMLDTGVAADHLLHGEMVLTPSGGELTHLWMEDPAVGSGTQEEKDARANRPLNVSASLTSATSTADVVQLKFPIPSDPDVLEGLKNRSLRYNLDNVEVRKPITVGLVLPAPGLLRSRWADDLDDVVLYPGDRLRAEAHMFSGELDVDQLIRRAEWETVFVVPGSATNAAGNQRTIPVAAEVGDICVALYFRTDGMSIALPGGKGYQTPTSAAGFWGDDGRLVMDGKAIRLAWCPVTAAGSFSTGIFSGGSGRILSLLLRGAAGIGQVLANYAVGATSIVFADPPEPLVPNAFMLDVTTALNVALAQSPAGNAVDCFHNGGGSPATSLAISHLGPTNNYDPPPSGTVATTTFTSTVLEVIPKRR